MCEVRPVAAPGCEVVKRWSNTGEAADATPPSASITAQAEKVMASFIFYWLSLNRGDVA